MYSGIDRNGQQIHWKVKFRKRVLATEGTFSNTSALSASSFGILVNPARLIQLGLVMCLAWTLADRTPRVEGRHIQRCPVLRTAVVSYIIGVERSFVVIEL